MKSTTRRNFCIAGTAAAAAIAGGLYYFSERYNTVITRWWSGTFTEPETVEGMLTEDEARNNSAELSIEVMGEGAVLLKNNGTLPLKDLKVAFLGYSSYHPVYMGAGSVAQGGSSTGEINFYDAFREFGYDVDSTMENLYNGTDDRGSVDIFNLQGANYSIGDPEISEYSDRIDEVVANGYKTAIVVYGRAGGEGGDLPLDMSGKTNGDAGKHYLELQHTEQDLLDYAKEKFDNVIVILDSSNMMELGFLEDDKVDAALWIGAPGGWGTKGVAKVIKGDYNPSGHLVDTCPYEVESNPTYYNCTAGTYTNYDEFDDSANGFDNKVDGGVVYYPEGVYMGYRYYETAGQEGTIDYDKTVQYPFGFGLSYTTFDWAIKGQSLGDVHGEITVDVEVTNTGDVAGKDVVQLYFEAPYIPGGIEKPARVLGAFAKTSLLDPGASETVTLTMLSDELASYDYKNERTWVADAGEYKLHIQTDSHNDKEGCDPIVFNIANTRVYNENGVGPRSHDATVATNQFDPSSNGDGNIGATIPWMTRDDLAGTHPEKTMGDTISRLSIAMGDTGINYMKSTLGGSDVDWSDDSWYEYEGLVPAANDEKNGLTCADFAGYTEWNDELWDKLVNQMSIEDQVQLVCDCAYGTPAIESIGKELTTDVDGPAGISTLNLNYQGHEHCGEPVTAATWNVDLAHRMGECVGDEARAAAINGWYAPGCDTHRTPFGGRCAEYYSEDPLLSGKICAQVVSAMMDKGVNCYIKHIVMNDQDQNRGGMYTWCNEQAIREIYLKAFEYPIKAGCSHVMYGYNRIGPMENSVCRGLTRGVLHGEWGTHVAGLTDGYAAMFGCDGYENPDLQIRAGGGMLLFVGGFTRGTTDVLTERTTGSEKAREMLHDMCKRVLYHYCNCNIMTVKRDYTPYWKWVRTGICGVLGAGVAAAWINHAHKCKKEKERQEMLAESASNRVENDEPATVYITDGRTFMRAGYKTQLAVCPNCGARLNPYDVFCHNCGQQIKDHKA